MLRGEKSSRRLIHDTCKIQAAALLLFQETCSNSRMLRKAVRSTFKV